MSCISAFVSTFANIETCSKAGKSLVPIFDFSNKLFDFLPSEEKVNAFWDAFVTLGDKVDPLTKNFTKLNLKFPDNSFAQKIYEFVSQPKLSEQAFNWPTVFKRPAKELFAADKKAKARFHAALQAECMLN